jgi:hypothetical protein
MTFFGRRRGLTERYCIFDCRSALTRKPVRGDRASDLRHGQVARKSIKHLHAHPGGDRRRAQGGEELIGRRNRGFYQEAAGRANCNLLVGRGPGQAERNEQASGLSLSAKCVAYFA